MEPYLTKPELSLGHVTGVASATVDSCHIMAYDSAVNKTGEQGGDGWCEKSGEYSRTSLPQLSTASAADSRVRPIPSGDWRAGETSRLHTYQLGFA